MHTKDQNIIKYKTIKENIKNIYFLTFWGKEFFLHNMLSNQENKKTDKKNNKLWRTLDRIQTKTRDEG